MPPPTARASPGASGNRGLRFRCPTLRPTTLPAPPPLSRYIARKGSICIDGVSLTVNAVDDAGFEVALIPHTIAHTAFATTTVGAAVNLEVDLVARYVERLLATREHA